MGHCLLRVRRGLWADLFSLSQLSGSLASHSARKLLENRVPKTVFVHDFVFSCECVCLCVKIKGEREGVGYQPETSLL